MSKYRLKKEAIPFFNDKLSTAICDWHVWNEYHVDDKALEEVEEVYIDYGIKTSDTGSTLSGWKNGEGSELRFTIKFPSMKHYEYDKFTKGKMVRELMNRIQNVANGFADEFYQGTLENKNKED